ncbi:MAG: enoyl-CoA hydratase/isomerase family protein [Candidatus Binatia bacterium]|jgi:enoyl-CoA hydratase/carnithine racemase|nr:enoyl-CoA hydratase/isomerase family protein [Candidatus Binatia bacterium]MDG1959610.1 enoyl-CoA hydratase/isomerase family protein [Candidatus Binatia bacterium]MDG2010329.1 enoyl-CoA hydratase/isomerase family protein [Candidatus Binatia bacterium]HAC79367.1 enoyl-CoA hydratase/isomerase family protein [Deltaproteobacteria bacterium]
MGAAKILLEIDGGIATITNNNAGKHNAFDDAMDAELFAALREIRDNPELRVVLWKGDGKSWSSGRDTGALKDRKFDLPHHGLMDRGQKGSLQLLELDIPIICALHGWVMGGSFQRALLCDIRIAAPDTRFRLPELTYGVVPDLGGPARLFQMCGHGIASDMILTGRVMEAEEALRHGVISRIVSPETLEETAQEMAEAIVKSPQLSVKLARRILKRLGDAETIASIGDENLTQSVINASHDFAEWRAAYQEKRKPGYKNA